MGYFQSNKITKLIFLLIWPFFILRIPTYFKLQENFSKFDITNIKSLILLSTDITLLSIFLFLILIQIFYFFKHRIISKSIILIIYPIIGVIGYQINGYENLYQDGILLHHFITLSATFLFFSFIQSNKLFDYKFKELCLKIIFSIIFIYFLSIILPSLLVKLYLGQDLRYSYVTSVYIFAKEITLKQNINGQTKFIFILFLFSMFLFKKFYSKKKRISYLFFLIGLILISLIFLGQSRLNILASFVFSIFFIISIKDLTLKNKLSFLILIFTIPLLMFNFNENIKNRFSEKYTVILPQKFSDKNKLALEINEQKKLIFSKIESELRPAIRNIVQDEKLKTISINKNKDGKPETITINTDKDGRSETITIDTDKDGKPETITIDTDKDGIIDTWYEDKNFEGKADLKGIDTDNDTKPDIIIPTNNVDIKLDIKDMEFNLQMLNLEILNKNNKINYDVYLDHSIYLKEINRKKKPEELLYGFPKLYSSVLRNMVNQNKNIVLGQCLKILVRFDSILSGRLCGWQILYNIIEKPELIFGKGFFADQVYLNPVEKVASNFFINVLFNTGLISLLIYMAVILIFFIKYFKFENFNHTNIYISSSHYLFIYFIFRSFFEDNLAFVSVDLLLLGAVSVLIKHNSQHTNN